MKKIIFSGLIITICSYCYSQALYTDIAPNDRRDILFDNFEDNSSNWYTGDNGKTRATIRSGYYNVESLVDQPRVVYKDISINTSGDWEIETSIQYISGQDNNMNALEWSWVDGDNNYSLGMSGNGYYVIKKIENGKWTVILDWKKSLIRQDEYNKLTVRKIENTYYFFVNENLIHQMPYEPVRCNKLGIQVNDKSSIKVDFFRASQILYKSPIITWIDPSNNSANSSSDEYLLKAKITSGTEISEFTLLNNGFPVKVSKDDLVKIGKEYFFQKKVLLSQGGNKIVLNTSNSQGNAISNPIMVMYGNEIKTVQGSISKQEDVISNLGTSDIDENIPQNPINPKRFALIIGNEDYTSYQRNLSSEANVAYAINDATAFKIYAQKILGVEDRNIFFLTNATAGAMNQKIELITRIASKLNGSAELFFYYAGHGFPDENTKIPYLIPVDVSILNINQGIKLSDLYQKLNGCGAKRVFVFLDACFSGGGREGGLINSRGVKVRPKEEDAIGNLVVFAASSGEQTSLPYKEKRHGMFTYFLLKKLKESKGDLSYGELAKYIQENVSIESLRTNYQEQDPQIKTSSTLQGTWEKWKFAPDK